MDFFLSKQSNLNLKKLALLGLVSSSLLVSGCTMPTQEKPIQTDTVSSADISARKQFVVCKADALALDSSAKQRQSPAQYLSSANTLNQCLLEVDGFTHVVPLDERMQVHALTVLNYLKGGDIKQAKLQLDAFELAYPNSDLLFSDYTSFIDSMRVVLSHQGSVLSRSSSLNINDALQSHVNRQRYWQTH